MELTAEQIAARGREVDHARWELPKRYQLQSALLSLPPEELKERDPEMYAVWKASQAEQDRLAKEFAMAGSSLSPQDAERARSVVIAEKLRLTLSDLDKKIGAVLTSGGTNLAELQTAKTEVQHQLAERYAIIGRYDLATEIEPDPTYRDHYFSILEAIWRPNDEWCECPPAIGSGEHSSLSLSRQFVKEEVFSIKEGKVVYLLKCAECNTMNAVPHLPGHLQQQRSHRSKAQALAKNLSPQDAVAVLQRAGHTTANLLK